MTAVRFRVAMFNQLRLGPYDAPHVSAAPNQEWLIVERSGADGEYLLVSDGRSDAEVDDGPAPADLVPGNTLVALLAKTKAGTDPIVQFIFVRHPPVGLVVGGTFFPADGFAEIVEINGELRLSAVGRHFHTRGECCGDVVLHDVCDPAPGAGGGVNWHFDAEQRPWPAQA